MADFLSEKEKAAPMIINTEPSFDPASFGATESDYKIAAWKPQKNTRKGFRSIRASFTRRDQSRSDGTSRRPLISAPSDFRHVRSSSHESDMKTSGFGVQSVSRPVGRIPVVSVTQRNHVRPLEYDAHWPYQRISPTVPRFELHRIATSTPPPAYCAERLEQAHVWSQQRGYSSKPGQPGRITSAYDDVSRIPAKSKYQVRAGAALEVDVIRKCLATDVVKAEKLQGQIEDAIEQEGFYDSSCLSTSHSVAPTVPGMCSSYVFLSQPRIFYLFKIQNFRHAESFWKTQGHSYPFLHCSMPSFTLTPSTRSTPRPGQGPSAKGPSEH